MASLSFKHLYKKYPGNVTAVSDFTLEVRDKEFLILVGPSGCGKTTTLRMVAGLEEITEGELFIGDKLVNDIAPKDRDIAMVFQNYALYPHMTVFDNMAFGLKLRKTPKEEIKRRVEEAARILDIVHLLDRRPKALSGGQKQRVALGRAIVREPKVFLLDEPLSNLDAKLRAQMRTELTKIHKRLQTTFLYVTHDQVEAMTMATRIVVMKDGLIQQVDTPQNLYDYPTNLFVAGFIGTPQMNFINAFLEQRADGVYAKFGDPEDLNNPVYAYFKIAPEKASDPAIKDYIGKDVVIGIRPECLHDDAASMTAFPDSVIEADIDVTELMGAEILQYVNCCNINLVARVSNRSTARAGDRIKIAIENNRLHIFDKDTEKCLIH
ncbi:MAG: sn-glycerol-3-phosphate ABC transporter ATP-binding protein UgpC [Clostridiales bacterium]|jgi:multiple sugar transport system ATP-binding protein|nr:sn-glycerol-3-phosphate ABC transporter ATP-binding protein UgpC [Clostridiales bacterium]